MKKTMLISLALVLALGTLGVAYAMWQDDLTVKSNIKTGSVCIDISSQDVLDDIPPNGDYLTQPFDWTCNDGFVQNAAGDDYWSLNKNVSWGKCEIAADGKSMVVVLHDTYPSNFNEVTLHIRNCGTIPLKIQETDVYKWDGAAWVYVDTFDAGTGKYLPLNMDGDADFELEMSWGNSLGTQIEPGDTPEEISYWIHTRQDADQGATYKLRFVILAVQYNEYIGP